MEDCRLRGGEVYFANRITTYNMWFYHSSPESTAQNKGFLGHHGAVRWYSTYQCNLHLSGRGSAAYADELGFPGAPAVFALQL